MERPGDDDLVPMGVALRWQREYVLSRRSRVCGLVLAAVAEAAEGGDLRSELPAVVRFGDLPGLRVMATVHRLALERRAAAVAIHLPTLGGTPPQGRSAEQAFGASVVQCLLDHPRELAEGLQRTPQTNETGRAVLLRMVLSRLPTQPVVLVELGASAGLNLRADHLPGRPDLERGTMPTIVTRVGCDRAPIDPTTPEGRLTLSSYVWVDDVDRFARLGRAMEVAARVPATLVRADAADFLDALDLTEDTTTVVWHSAFWVYLSAGARERITDRLGQLGETAGAGRRLVHASWAWDPGSADGFRLVTTTWSGAEPVTSVLAVGTSHGDLVTLQSA